MLSELDTYLPIDVIFVIASCMNKLFLYFLLGVEGSSFCDQDLFLDE